MPLAISFDEDSDVLYVKREGARIVNSEFEEDDDWDCVLNLDASREVVGVQLFSALSKRSRCALSRSKRLPQSVRVLRGQFLSPWRSNLRHLGERVRVESVERAQLRTNASPFWALTPFDGPRARAMRLLGKPAVGLVQNVPSWAVQDVFRGLAQQMEPGMSGPRSEPGNQGRTDLEFVSHATPGAT